MTRAYSDLPGSDCWPGSHPAILTASQNISIGSLDRLGALHMYAQARVLGCPTLQWRLLAFMAGGKPMQQERSGVCHS